MDDDSPIRLVIRAMAGRWVVWQARQRTDERWIVADGDDSHTFHVFHRAMNSFGLDAQVIDKPFPNMRLLHTNERFAPRFFPPRSLSSIHVHLPWPARASRPPRAALVNPLFLSDASDALEPMGELHVVTDDETVVQEICGALTRSKLFSPSRPFPFHEVGVPRGYPSERLLQADIASCSGATSSVGSLSAGLATSGSRALFYTRWQRRPPLLPNFRFKSGQGYSEAVQGRLTRRDAEDLLLIPPPPGLKR